MLVRYVIATEGLTKYYGRVKALENLNLRIEEGRFVGLLGPNGAGKTTTIKLLCGMLRPTRGRAFVLGLDPFRERCEVLARVGALVESPNFYQELTAEEILEYAGRLRGMYGRVLRERVCEVLEIVGLGDHARKRVRASILRFLVEELGLSVYRFTEARLLLEDVYVKLVEES